MNPLLNLLLTLFGVLTAVVGFGALIVAADYIGEILTTHSFIKEVINPLFL